MSFSKTELGGEEVEEEGSSHFAIDLKLFFSSFCTSKVWDDENQKPIFGRPEETDSP